MYINCPVCDEKLDHQVWVSLKECPKCGTNSRLVMLVFLLKDQIKDTYEEIKDIKRWLKGRNIPTETKDELRRRLNKIGG